MISRVTLPTILRVEKEECRILFPAWASEFHPDIYAMITASIS
jgi:hypothetical protein